MRKTLLSIAALLVATFGFGQSTEWKIDHSHSNVTFEIAHMVVATVTGKFERFEGKILADKEDFTDASISFTIETASVNTNNQRRDDHLRNDDFFDVENKPYITFNGKKMEKKTGNNYSLTGDLTMNGVTREVELEVRFNGTIQDPWGGTRAGFRVSGELNRYDYDLTWNNTLEAGGLLVGEMVDLRVNLELIKQ
jgi:polyisoprenoid-binding protein YceI